MKYSTIVIGAGAAGCALAARLSEDPDRSVLLIEAGPDAPGTEFFPEDIRDAARLTGAMPGHPHNWGFLVQLAPGVDCIVARGRILGGSTAINGSYLARARKSDCDRWEAAGNSEWSYENVLPYFIRLEDDLLYGDSEIHGSGGPVAVHREIESPSEFTLSFYAAAKELGFQEDPDKNDMTVSEGYGPLPINAVDGLRINTGIAYINPVRHRPNLDIMCGTEVSKILFDGSTAVAVQTVADGRIEIIPGEEIVLCAGAIKSAHLLLLSGIGPADDLAAAGIPVLHHAPGVGRNFSDHPDICLVFEPTRRLDPPETSRLFEAVLNLTSTGAANLGDIEILPMLRPFGRAMQTESGQNDPNDNNVCLIAALQQPSSRGQITIRTPDHRNHPDVSYAYLDHEADRAGMREALRTCVRLLETRAFSSIFERLVDLDAATLNDDAGLDQWALEHVGTAVHMVGTAKMGPPWDPMAVVDQYGRVHGVRNLRVADTSILPDVPTRGTAATAIMIGEKMADFMRRSDGCPRPSTTVDPQQLASRDSAAGSAAPCKRSAAIK